MSMMKKVDTSHFFASRTKLLSIQHLNEMLHMSEKLAVL